MSTYTGTYSCGHEGEYRLVGCPRKDRDWKVENHFSYECPDCKRKAIDEEMNIKFAEAKTEDDKIKLPSLRGTEKQVRWATILRRELIKKFIDFKSTKKSQKNKIIIDFTLDYILQTKLDADYYISYRDNSAYFMISLEGIAAKEWWEENKKIEEEKLICGTDIIKPENPTHEGIAELYIHNNTIFAKYIKNDDFIKVMHDKGFEWSDMIWNRKITLVSGDIADRLIETANALLLKGFTVEVPKGHKEKILKGDFTPQKNIWILFNDDDKFSIKFYKRNDENYNIAKQIIGSCWDRDTQSLLIPIEKYKEVLDFKEKVNAGISEKALNLIKKYKNKNEGENNE